jgi:F0F1-type ATP synthase assembly protein I
MIAATFVSAFQWFKLFLNHKNAAFAARANTFGSGESYKIICRAALFYNSEVLRPETGLLLAAATTVCAILVRVAACWCAPPPR